MNKINTLAFSLILLLSGQVSAATCSKPTQEFNNMLCENAANCAVFSCGTYTIKPGKKIFTISCASSNYSPYYFIAKNNSPPMLYCSTSQNSEQMVVTCVNNYSDAVNIPMFISCLKPRESLTGLVNLNTINH